MLRCWWLLLIVLRLTGIAGDYGVADGALALRLQLHAGGTYSYSNHGDSCWLWLTMQGDGMKRKD